MTRRCVAVVLAVLCLGLAGCVRPFQPDGSLAGAGREAMRPRLADLASQLTRDEPPLATVTRDGCRTGQNNFKVRDEFAHDCLLVHAVAFPAAATPDDVKDAIATMADRLAALGCTADGDLDLTQIGNAYWGSAREAAERDYRPGDMPLVSYRCDDLRVEIAYLDPVTLAEDAESYGYAWPDGWAYWWFDDELADPASVPPDELLRRVTDEGAAMVWSMSISGSYYQVRF